MGNNYHSYRLILFVLLNILLTKWATAAIYRPAGSPANLIADINTANSTPDDDIIDLGGYIYTYAVGSGYALPAIEDATGTPPAGKLSIINGVIERSRVTSPPTPDFGLFLIESGADLTLFNLTLENANASSGSAIDNFGTLNMENCLLQNNTANDGGAIYNNNGAIIDNIENSMFVGNTATSTGGGIRNDGTINNVNECTFSYNTANFLGGGIANTNFIGSISNSTFNNNLAAGGGGGIYSDDIIISLSNSTIYGNNSNSGTGPGGGIFNDIDSTIGIENCTISMNGNATTSGGGGIYNAGTITGLISNIIADNTAGSGLPQDIDDETGTITCPATFPLGYNLIGDNSSTGLTNGDLCNDIVIGPNIDPGLGALQNNGGPTLTAALLLGSLAINNGSNPSSLLYDQRGSPYRRVVCAVPDIGAFEYQSCVQ